MVHKHIAGDTPEGADSYLATEPESLPRAWSLALNLIGQRAVLPRAGVRVAVTATLSSPARVLGGTTDVRELLDAGRGKRRTLGAVGDPNTPLVDVVDDVITRQFADEQSVVKTRSRSTSLTRWRYPLRRRSSSAAVWLGQPGNCSTRCANDWIRFSPFIGVRYFTTSLPRYLTDNLTAVDSRKYGGASRGAVTAEATRLITLFSGQHTQEEM